MDPDFIAQSTTLIYDTLVAHHNFWFWKGLNFWICEVTFLRMYCAT